MLKKVVLAAFALILVVVASVLGMAMVKPSDYRIERSVEVMASSDAIFGHISELPEWEKWSPWKAKDPTMKIAYEGPKSGVGATQSWTSENSGAGSLKITDSVQNQKVRYLLTFKDWNSQSFGELALEPVSGATTRVKWVMEGKNDFMGKLFWMLFDFEKAISEDFDQGLAGIKRLSEQHAAPVAEQPQTAPTTVSAQ